MSLILAFVALAVSAVTGIELIDPPPVAAFVVVGTEAYQYDCATFEFAFHILSCAAMPAIDGHWYLLGRGQEFPSPSIWHYSPSVGRDRGLLSTDKLLANALIADVGETHRHTHT